MIIVKSIEIEELEDRDYYEYYNLHRQNQTEPHSVEFNRYSGSPYCEDLSVETHQAYPHEYVIRKDVYLNLLREDKELEKYILNRSKFKNRTEVYDDRTEVYGGGDDYVRIKVGWTKEVEKAIGISLRFLPKYPRDSTYVKELNDNIDRLSKQLSEEKRKSIEMINKINREKAEISLYNHELECRNRKMSKEKFELKNQFNSMSLWQRLKFLFKGN